MQFCARLYLSFQFLMIFMEKKYMQFFFKHLVSFSFFYLSKNNFLIMNCIQIFFTFFFCNNLIIKDHLRTAGINLQTKLLLRVVMRIKNTRTQIEPFAASRACIQKDSLYLVIVDFSDLCNNCWYVWP